MATRNVAGLYEKSATSTEYQLYDGAGTKNVVDFTEQKLIRYALKTSDPQQKLVLMALVEDYRRGTVAVAWRRGAAVWIKVKVTKET